MMHVMEFFHHSLRLVFYAIAWHALLRALKRQSIARKSLLLIKSHP